MSPTVFVWKGARFHFFSREEPRPHVHIACTDGHAKFWLEPEDLGPRRLGSLVELESAKNAGLSTIQVNELARVVKEHRDELIHA